MTLHERVAEVLGWEVEEAQSFSLQSLRELVRPVSPKLAVLLTQEVQSGRVCAHPPVKMVKKPVPRF